MRTEQMIIETVTSRIQPRRRIEGISAVLPPLYASGEPDHDALLRSLSGPEVVALYRQMAAGSGRLLALELSQQFTPFGRMYDLDTVRAIMEVEVTAGLKHSSIDRRLKRQRLARRDRAVLADIAARIQEWLNDENKI